LSELNFIRLNKKHKVKLIKFSTSLSRSEQTSRWYQQCTKAFTP